METAPGYHGGRQLVPVAATLTPANRPDSAAALTLRRALPPAVRYGLGERPSNTPEVREAGAHAGRRLVTSQDGRYPHTDDGVEVRRSFHQLRSTAIENFNEQCKGIFAGPGHGPTKGVTKTRRFALGAIFVYQLTLWYRFEHGLDLRIGLKPLLKAA